MHELTRANPRPPGTKSKSPRKDRSVRTTESRAPMTARRDLMAGQATAMQRCRQPFRGREPSIECGNIRVIDSPMDRLPVHGCWKSVGQHCRAGTLEVAGSNRPTGESAPPARTMPKDDHQVHRQGERCTEATLAPHALVDLVAGRVRGRSKERSGNRGERNGLGDPERCCPALQLVAMPLSPFREVTVSRLESSGSISCDNP